MNATIQKMSKRVILTGLRANNDLHIGNYFGALLPIVDMANKRAGEYQINLFVPDLHSFTTPIDHRSLFAQTMHNLKIFAAAGLDLQNPDLFLYRQSYVPAHSELTWILDCFSYYGQLNRMTQFKEKSAKIIDQEYDEKIISGRTAGLFTYPVLMAADILLYGASYVPVGDDQSQHLEFTRDIAERMNKQFADMFPDGLFTIPLTVAKQHAFFGKDQGLRIRNLRSPNKKMSKSDESDKGIIFLGDDPEAAARKIRDAETDSLAKVPAKLDYEKQPGLSNLLQILALLEQKSIDEVISQWAGKTSYGHLKSTLADKVKALLTDFQSRLERIDEQALQTKLESSEATMSKVADDTLLKVQQAVGLRPIPTPIPSTRVQEAYIDTYTAELEGVGIENSVIEHPPSKVIAEVIASLQLTLADTMPTLVMKVDGDFLAVVLRGDTKVDFKKLKKVLGAHNLRMATPDEFIKFTGLPLGAARVYIPNTTTIIDSRVFSKEYLIGGSGRFDCSVRYKTTDLLKIPGSQIADVSQ